MMSSARSQAFVSLQTAPRSRQKAMDHSTLSLNPGQELSLSTFDIQANELLHHYTTILYKSLAGNRKHTVWRVDMPQVALSFPFLLSGILAFSALHLSTLVPQRMRQLQNYAIAQQSAALPLFRQSMSNRNEETIHAIFAFAGYVIYYVMAAPPILHNGKYVDRSRIPSRDDEHPHWFQTMRGMMALLATHRQALAEGPFAPLIGGASGPYYTSGPEDPDHDQLTKLEEMFPPSSPLASTLLSSAPTFCLSPSSPLLSQEQRNDELCREALKELRRVSAVHQSPNRVVFYGQSIHVWPGSISQDFVELIYDRHPKALILLAHYCVQLKRNDHVWYLKGLGAGLLNNIRQALGEEWWPWIQWAIEQPSISQV